MRPSFRYRLYLLIELAALALFLYGFFAGNPWLTNIGGGYLIFHDVLSIFAGTLRPGIPILSTLVGVALVDPWWYGAYWASAVFTLIASPISLLQLIAPPPNVMWEDQAYRVRQGADSGEGSTRSSEDENERVQAQKSVPAGLRYVGIIVGVVVVAFAAYYMGASGWEFRLPGQVPLAMGTEPVESNSIQNLADPGPTDTVVPTPTQAPAATPTEVPWVTGFFVDGLVELAYPSDHEVTVDGPLEVGIIGQSTGFNLKWGENVTGEDTKALVDILESRPGAAAEFRQNTHDWYKSHAKATGAEIVSLSDPEIMQLDDRAAVQIDALLEVPGPTDPMPMRMLTLNYDCGEYVCQSHYYRLSKEVATVDDWESLFRFSRSIAFRKE